MWRCSKVMRKLLKSCSLGELLQASGGDSLIIGKFKSVSYFMLIFFAEVSEVLRCLHCCLVATLIVEQPGKIPQGCIASSGATPLHYAVLA